MGDLIDRQAAIDAMYELMGHWFGADSEDEKREIKREFDKLPSAERSYAQSIGKCETCYYWGNRIMMRDGSLGDCGNFGVSLSKDFFCAWWSQKEKEGEQDG